MQTNNPDVPWWALVVGAGAALLLWPVMAGRLRFGAGLGLDTGAVVGEHFRAPTMQAGTGWRPSPTQGPGLQAIHTGAGGGLPQGSYPPEVQIAAISVADAARREGGAIAIYPLDAYTIVRWQADGAAYRLIVRGPNLDGDTEYLARSDGSWRVLSPVLYPEDRDTGIQNI